MVTCSGLTCAVESSVHPHVRRIATEFARLTYDRSRRTATGRQLSGKPRGYFREAS
jgi:hypothetical protein